MKKLLAVILLISHINFSMFIAQVDEMDVYDKNGQQMEDVNSLVQYVANLCHIAHKPIKDSDDDNARFFHMEKLDYSLYRQLFEVMTKPAITEKTAFQPYKQQHLLSVCLEISSPPPRLS
jgi:hypothetical protein